MTKIWVENFHWDVVSACDTAGTSCCSVFIETLGLDFFIKADNDFENFKTLISSILTRKTTKPWEKVKMGFPPNLTRFLQVKWDFR